MNPKTKIKIAAFLLVPLAIFGTIDLIILQGGVFREKVGLLPKRVKPAALEISSSDKKLTANITVKNFTVKAKKTGSSFQKGTPIEISCTVENSSSGVLKNFRSVIRTPQKDLASSQIKSLKSGEILQLTNTFTPENSGALIVACRGDSEKQIEEINENDNREMVTLYILP